MLLCLGSQTCVFPSLRSQDREKLKRKFQNQKIQRQNNVNLMQLFICLSLSQQKKKNLTKNSVKNRILLVCSRGSLLGYAVRIKQQFLSDTAPKQTCSPNSILFLFPFDFPHGSGKSGNQYFFLSSLSSTLYYFLFYRIPIFSTIRIILKHFEIDYPKDFEKNTEKHKNSANGNIEITDKVQHFSKRVGIYSLITQQMKTEVDKASGFFRLSTRGD